MGREFSEGVGVVNEHERYMRLALDEARKSARVAGRGVGAIVVADRQVIGRSGYRPERLIDPTAHAETTAIRDASRNLGRDDLAGCTLYTTLEPCPMCCGAIIVSNISALVIGAREDPNKRRWGDYRVEAVLAIAGWEVEKRLITGILAEECVAVLQRAGREGFAERR